MKKESQDEEIANSPDPKIFGFNLRTDNELFNEEAYIPAPVIRAKRVGKKKEDWQIFEDQKLCLTLKGDKLTNKEKTFLRTVEGMQHLVILYKSGVRNITNIKNHLKRVV